MDQLTVEHWMTRAPITVGADIPIAKAIDMMRVHNIREAMTPDPCAITPRTSLEWALAEMVEHKYGSVVVVDRKKVVGVLTTIDVLRALQSLLGRARRRRA